MAIFIMIWTIICIAAVVLTIAVAAVAGLFTTESYKVFADTNDQSNVFQGENKFNNQTINSTFSIK